MGRNKQALKNKVVCACCMDVKQPKKIYFIYQKRQYSRKSIRKLSKEYLGTLADL
jgi:hypothetical protein